MRSKKQAGSSLIMVLVMLTVLALGALSLVQINQNSTILAGSMAYKAAAMQASEVGLSEAFAQLQAMASTDLDANQGSWYLATNSAMDTSGLPTGTTWSNPINVGAGYAASYFIERMCTVTPVTDVGNQCFIKRLPSGRSAKAGSEQMDALAAIQFRMTVYVQGPKGTQTYVQVMATRAS